MTDQLHFHFSLSCIGEGNGNPLQCSCLENPRDGGARWAAVYGVAQSQTWLKRLSSGSIFTSQKWQLGSPTGAQVETTPDHIEGLPSPLPIPPAASLSLVGSGNKRARGMTFCSGPCSICRVADKSPGQVSISTFLQY